MIIPESEGQDVNKTQRQIGITTQQAGRSWATVSRQPQEEMLTRVIALSMTKESFYLCRKKKPLSPTIFA